MVLSSSINVQGVRSSRPKRTQRHRECKTVEQRFPSAPTDSVPSSQTKQFREPKKVSRSLEDCLNPFSLQKLWS